jgi:type VI secretion system protein ImpA
MPFRYSIHTLLEPITLAAPCGESLRYEGTYDRIQQARQADDPSLARGVWKFELRKADWAVVQDLCVEALKIRTKDLQIACWLTEAWLHLHEVSGFAEGMRLQNELCRKYWDGMYPQIEAGDVEYRITPVQWINEKLSLELKMVPLTTADSDDKPRYTLADWEAACRAPTLPKEGPNAPRVTLAQFGQSATLTPTKFLDDLMDDLHAALAECQSLEALFDEKCGEHAPSLRQVALILESIRGILHTHLSQREREKPAEAPPPVADVEAAPAESIEHLSEEHIPAPKEKGTGPIRSRADAYRMLQEAADYLAIIEPHSPTPYLVRRAINWGDMKLGQLLTELVQNRQDLDEILRLLQIPK